MRLTAETLAVARSGRVLARDLTFAVAPGEALALVGPNGAGKTTLLRVLAGLVRPHAGNVAFEQDGSSLEPDAARDRLHWLGVRDALHAGRTAEQEAVFWAAWAGGAASGADRALDEVGLTGAAALDVRRLSSGQRRRLAMARLLAAPRPLWLLDEPLAPLDAEWRGRVANWMSTHLDSGGLVIAAVHDPLPVPHRTLELKSAA